jgi:hypothetical protein
MIPGGDFFPLIGRFSPFTRHNPVANLAPIRFSYDSCLRRINDECHPEEPPKALHLVETEKVGGDEGSRSQQSQKHPRRKLESLIFKGILARQDSLLLD